jgi:hypothetical protein
MAHDAFFFDHATHTYTVDRYVNDVTARYGGIDSVLIWPTYPNIGIDARNQFDMIRDMPDGFAAAVRQFQLRHNISVLLPYNPWDIGTRPEGASDADAHRRTPQRHWRARLQRRHARGRQRDVLARRAAHRRADCHRARGGRRRVVALVHQARLGLLDAVLVRARRRPLEVARAPPPHARVRALGARPPRRAAGGVLQRLRLRVVGERLGHVEPDLGPRRRRDSSASPRFCALRAACLAAATRLAPSTLCRTSRSCTALGAVFTTRFEARAYVTGASSALAARSAPRRRCRTPRGRSSTATRTTRRRSRSRRRSTRSRPASICTLACRSRCRRRSRSRRKATAPCSACRRRAPPTRPAQLPAGHAAA